MFLTIENNCETYTNDPTELPVTVPIELDGLIGTENGRITDDIWSVPYKFYSLTKVRLWKGNYSNKYPVSGFEVTYESELEGYPPMSHLFGTTIRNTYFEEVNLKDET